MAAVLALPELHSVRVRIGVWRIARCHGKRLVAEALGGLRENQTRFGRRQRRLRIIVLSRCLEGIATRLDSAPNIPSLPGDAEQFFPQSMVRLQLRIGDAPVLYRQF